MPPPLPVPNFGVGSEAVLGRTAELPSAGFLVLENTMVKHFHLRVFQQVNSPPIYIESDMKIGRRYIDLSQLPANYHSCVFSASGSDVRLLPLTYHSNLSFQNSGQTVTVATSLYAGMAFLVMILALVLYIALKRRVLLYYFLFVVASFLSQALVFGFGESVLYPGNDWLIAHETTLFVPFTSVFGFLFIWGFIGSNNDKKPFRYLFNVVIGTSFTLFLVGLFTSSPENIRSLVNINSGITALIMLAFCIRRIRRGQELHAKIFLIGWLGFIAGIIVFNLKDLGIIAYSPLANSMMTIGSAFEIIVFTCLMGLFVKSVSEERVRYEELAVDASNKYQVELALHSKLAQDHRMLKAKTLKDLMTPHLVYNGLISLRAHLYKKRYSEAENMVSEYAMLFREAMQAQMTDYLEIQDDLSLLEKYVHVEADTFKKGIDLSIVCDPRLSQRLIPTFVLQPIVENAIQHGLTLVRDRVPQIKIAVTQNDENSVLVTVEDNGIGIEAASKIKKATDHKSLALRILQKRSDILQEMGYPGISIHFHNRALDGEQGTRAELMVSTVAAKHNADMLNPSVV